MPINAHTRDTPKKDYMLEIRTFTNFWNMEKKLYTIYDVTLPMPISLKVAGAFLVTGIPWWGLMILLQVPFGSFFMFWLFPPVILGYLASKPIFQKKTLTQFLHSQIKYMFQPKRLSGLKEIGYGYQTYHFSSKIFKRTFKG